MTQPRSWRAHAHAHPRHQTKGVILMSKPRKLMLTAVAALGITAAAAGCGEKFNDAPVDNYVNTPADVIEMPDQFSNQATLCVPQMDGKRMFVSSNDQGSRAVIVDDPNCVRSQP